MKKITHIVLAFAILIPFMEADAAVTDIPVEQVRQAIPDRTPPHPRLLLSDVQLPALRRRIESDLRLKSFYEALLKQAQVQLDQSPVERVLTGRRLLHVSRECLQRVFLWSLAYRLEGDRQYLERAEREMLAALDSALGTDFGLSQKNGFSKTAEYYLHVCGPTGLNFNYPDCRPGKSFTPAVFWFAQKYNAPAVAWNEYRLWASALWSSPQSLTANRMAPLALLWLDGEPVVPEQTAWMGGGSNPVALFRTAWNVPDAVYLAFKAGSPGVNHGHRDVGSFVMDADGVRWAVDLGPEDYHKIESLGMHLWDMAPDSDRWKIFRYNNFSHNTLVVNGKHQVIDATAPIIRYSDEMQFPRAVIDMSAVYAGQLQQALRGAAILPSGQVLIQDELTAPADAPAAVRWAMATPAKVQIESAQKAILQQHGKTLQFEVFIPADEEIELHTWPTDPKTDDDAPNPGIVMLSFETKLEPAQEIRIAVLMTPQSIEKPEMFQMQPLLHWSPPLE